MENIKHSIENRFFIREEKNGITVYERSSNLFNFYEGITWNDVVNSGVSNADDFEDFLESISDRISINIDSKYPFNINWLIEDKCNLDCIYCFADDKFYLDRDRDSISTAKSILRLNSLTVGITGGEPTLNPDIDKIIEMFAGKIAITIDTNGTTPKIIKLIPLLKKANVMVRITIDTVDNDLLNKLRPPKHMPEGGYDQVGILTKNIKALVDAGVPVMVHTVLTKLNINKTEDIAETLIDIGVKRWHLYGVNYAEKCKHFFEKIKVTKKEVSDNKELLLSKYGDEINITHSLEDDFSANAVVLINSNGEFFVDTITDGIRYIGQNPKKPTIEELAEYLNYDRHADCYLTFY